MELIAVHLARVIAFLEVLSLDPRGSTTPQEGFADLGARYGFARVPNAVADLDFANKGVAFSFGRFEHIAIEQLTLYTNGLSIDTRSSTDDSVRVLSDLLAYTKARSGEPRSSPRGNYSSVR